MFLTHVQLQFDLPVTRNLSVDFLEILAEIDSAF